MTDLEFRAECLKLAAVLALPDRSAQTVATVAKLLYDDAAAWESVTPRTPLPDRNAGSQAATHRRHADKAKAPVK